MTDYTLEEIERMQNDAIKRVEDMQKKSKAVVELEKRGEEENSKNINDSIKGLTSFQEPKRVSMPPGYLNNLKDLGENSNKNNREELPKIKSDLPFLSKITSYLKDIKIDKDKTLLLSLIILLSEEKADEVLIMALIYMLT